ncbi:MAG: class I SAM-dependent methyltransferase [bacterium]
MNVIINETDPKGRETLNVISKADKFNNWMYQTIKPFCKGKIIEIGSGIGNISQYFLSENFKILLSDLRKEYCELLEKQFNDNPNFLGTEMIDIVSDKFDSKYANYLGKFETVYSLNVIEHVEDDYLFAKNSSKLLQNDGHLILLAPAFQSLYNNFDKSVGHFRRYDRNRLRSVFSDNFKIIHTQYFNAAGILGWYLSGKILKNKIIPKSQMRLYNYLVPVFQLLDKALFNQIGLSVIVVGKKMI